jgi:N-acetylglucosamine kinase-like BadF-type ATPase
MQKYYLGVDVGSTKTHALIADADGNAISLGDAGAGNPEGVGYAGLSRVISESTGIAFMAAGLSARQIAGAGFGIAGYDWPGDRQPVLEMISRLGLECPLEAVNDVVLGLFAGTSQGWGVAVDAGTGNNVRGRDSQGREAGITGEGTLFGEYGGAGELVHRAMIAVSYEYTGRGPATRLSQAFMQKTGAHDLVSLLEGVARGRYQPDAEAARLVFQTAAEGDPVAHEVIAWCARELGYSTSAVIRKLELQDLAFEVVLIGSLFKGGALFIEPFQETVLETAPRAKFVHLEAPPAVGATLLGMKISGLETSALRTRLINTVTHSSILQDLEAADGS